MSRVLRCELCGDSFVCEMGSGKCWCAEVKVSSESLNALHEQAMDCVCPNCLNRIAQN